MKYGVREVECSIPVIMAEWTKGLGILVHNEVWCAEGCGFDLQTGQCTRGVFHPARITGKVLSANMSFYFKLKLYLEL